MITLKGMKEMVIWGEMRLVHNGRALSCETGNGLKINAVVHVVCKMYGGGR